MGYYVDTAEREITIKKDQFDNCYKAMCKLNDNDDIKRGGGWNTSGVTSDNPRSEEPASILQDMHAGLDAEMQKKVLTIIDRKEAIRTAVMLAKPADIILVAGKGHEKYQEIKGERFPFDDKEVLISVIKELNK